MSDFFYVNDRLLAAEESVLPVQDRSYLLGDGLFETILVHSGRPVFLREHLERLTSSAHFFGYSWPGKEYLAGIIHLVIKSNSLPEGALRLTVSPAKSEGLLAAAESTLNITVTCRRGGPYGDVLYKKGFRAVIARTTRRNEHSPLSRHKTTNFLDSIVARREAYAAGADEALLLNTAGKLAEASASNVFTVHKGEVLTPSVTDGALPGVVRAKVSELCALLGIPWREASLSQAALQQAEEAFLTNSLLGLMPLVSIDGRPVGEGAPGSITRLLEASYTKQLTYSDAPPR
ncbi:MAG: aminotransferase class IV [Dethiobacter sp.]|nr:aminotransferase class IV [Dethiobacter sp.]MCL5982013.1 aminotransferase class IV [Bacillota bacterium]